MFRFTNKSWVLATLTIFALAFEGLALASPVSATATTPPPTAADFNPIDSTCAGNDTFTGFGSADYSTGVNNELLQPGKIYSTNGASTITIEVMDNTTFQMVKPDIVLSYSADGACGPDAPNAYSIEFGACDPVWSRTAVDGVVYQTPDSVRRYQNIGFRPVRLAGGGVSGTYTEAQVLDGETRHVHIGQDARGLDHATYRFDVYKDGVLDASLTAIVPSCGTNTELPPGDPGLGDGGQGHSSAPKGSIRQVGHQPKLKVKAINKKVDYKTVFYLRAGKGPARKFVVAKAGVSPKPKVISAKYKVLYTLYYKVKVKGKTKLIVVAQGRARPGANGPNGPS